MGAGGPKTLEGKATVARNAISHGAFALVPVIPGMERAQDWEAHRDGVLASLSPVGHLEQELAERIALLLWRLRRVVRFETAAITNAQNIVDRRFDTPPAPSVLDSLMDPDPPVPEPTLKEVRAAAETARARLRALEVLFSLPDDAPLSDDALQLLLEIASPRQVDRLQSSPAPTVGRARRILSGETRDRPDEWLSAQLEQAKEDAEAAAQQLAKLTIRRDHERTQQLIPPGRELDRVVRYEAHLQRQLLSTLHELEALQNRRAGQAAPFARLEISGLPGE